MPPSRRSVYHMSRKPDLLDDINNATLGFQKIFAIGLPSRTDHRDALSLAAAFSKINIEYSDGVTAVENKTLPPDGIEAGVDKGSINGWRAHMNLLRMIVEQNITSALVLEDDVDWDIRIKSQMRDFARASRLLIQPLKGTNDTYLDPTWPRPDKGQDYQNIAMHSQGVLDPTTSPYGDVDRWDVLWVGHCGNRFPTPEDLTAPLGRVPMYNDTTVPEHQHLDMELGNADLLHQYPAHTRVVSRARQSVCTLGYGITQQGARRLLYELGVRRMNAPFDLMLREVCDGVRGRELAMCVSVQPQLFAHHRPVGPRAAFSNIADLGDGYNERAFTHNVRWSVRLNFERLVAGRTDWIDQFQDQVDQVEITPDYSNLPMS